MRQRSINRLLAGAVLFLPAACDDFAAHTAAGQLDADADADALPRLVAVEEVRIGSLDDPDVGFTQIGGVDVDRDGRIYVLERGDVEIRVYGPEGTLQRTIGRRGEGPGEFISGASSFGVVGDTVWAVEARTLARLTLFDREGNVLATGTTPGVPVAIHDGYSAIVMPAALGSDGLFVGSVAFALRGPAAPLAPGAGSVGPGDTVPVPIARFDASGVVVDTVGWDVRPPRPPPPPVIRVGESTLEVPVPDDGPLVLTLPGGRAVVDRPLPSAADEGVFTVIRLGLRSDTVYSRRFRYAPFAYAPAFLDLMAGTYARAQAAGADSAAARRAIRAAMDFPAFHLPVDALRAGADGALWLRRTDVREPNHRWIVLDPQGGPLGEIELSRALRIHWSQGDVFWASETDQYGVPWLLRFQIREG